MLALSPYKLIVDFSFKLIIFQLNAIFILNFLFSLLSHNIFKHKLFVHVKKNYLYMLKGIKIR
jgi:hypothetical protein